MRINQLIPSVRAEVEKPFEEKLIRAKQLIRMFANKNACVSCSFGKDSITVLWLALQINPKIPVIFNNTGVEFPETLAFKEHLKIEWNLNLIETKPEKTYWEVPHSEDGSKRSVKTTNNACCYYLKEKPTKLAMREANLLRSFTGCTACESYQRMLTACMRGQEYYVKRYGYWKLHPILYWSSQEVWDFIKANNLPINLAYGKYGIDRIGCVPCTAFKGWRPRLARINPAMYKFISEKYFGQKLLDFSVNINRKEVAEKHE